MTKRTVVLLAAGCVIGLVVIAAVVLMSAGKRQATETEVTFKCSGNATINMKLHGNSLLSVESIRRSNCSVHVTGARVTIQCPAKDVSEYLSGHSAAADGMSHDTIVG